MSVMTFSCTQILLFTLIPYLSEALELSLSSIIASFALGTALFLFGAPFWSKYSEISGRFKTLGFGLCGLMVSFYLIVLLMVYSSELVEQTKLAILISSRIIYGLFSSAIVPVSQLTRSDMASSSEQMNSMFSHSLSLNLGRALGPLIILSGSDQYLGLLIIVATWTILPILLCFTVEEDSRQASNDASSSKNLKSQIMLPLGITILFTTFTGILHSSLGVTISEVFNLHGKQASMLTAKVLFAGSIVMAVTQILGIRFLKNEIVRGLTFGLIFLAAGSIVLIVMSQNIELWLAVALICAGLALIYPTNLTLFHRKFRNSNISGAMGLLASGNTIGYAVGGALASVFLGKNANLIALLIVVLICMSSFKNFKEVMHEN